MTNKISNSNKTNINIHIGDKGKKKRRHRRTTASKKQGSGNYVVNNMTATFPQLFSRSQTFDNSLGDDRERERIRIQRGIFESQTPSNNASNAFGNGAPANDYESFVGNVKRYMDEESEAQQPPTTPPPPTPPPAPEPPAPTPAPAPAPRPARESRAARQAARAEREAAREAARAVSAQKIRSAEIALAAAQRALDEVQATNEQARLNWDARV